MHAGGAVRLRPPHPRSLRGSLIRLPLRSPLPQVLYSATFGSAFSDSFTFSAGYSKSSSLPAK